MTEAIDLSDQIQAIRERYPQYWNSEEAVRDLRALWGGIASNEHGVFEQAERVRIELSGQWRGTVKIGRAPNGWHAVAVDHWYALGGSGSPLSVWNRAAYTSRDAALKAGINELIRKFEGVRDQQHAPQSQAAQAARMIERLEEERSRQSQLSLF